MDKQQTETKEGGEMMESNWNESVEHFEDLNIKELLLRGIYGFGFEKPSAI
jgi:translation initiation factor 4A